MWRRRATETAINGIRAALTRSTNPSSPLLPPRSVQESKQPHYIRQWSNRGGPQRDLFGRRIVYIRLPGRKDGYTRFGQQKAHRGLTRQQLRFIAIIGAGGTVIWISSRQEIPYTGRKHAILISTIQERQLGEQTYQQLLQDAKVKRTLLPSSHPASVAVRRVGSRIAAVATDGHVGGGFMEHMKSLNWEFSVIKSKEANAFVLPGGKVVVYTGLLNLIGREDELAAVLAHEVAHVVARHAAERMTQGSLLQLVEFIAYWGFGIPLPSGLLVGFFFLPNSRKAETEADVIGVQLAARACYQPEAAADVFMKLAKEEAKVGADKMPKFLRTHPVSEDRITAIRKMLPQAEMLGEAAGCTEPKTMLRGFEERMVGELGDAIQKAVPIPGSGIIVIEEDGHAIPNDDDPWRPPPRRGF